MFPLKIQLISEGQRTALLCYSVCELDSGGGESESCFCVIICSGALFYLRTFYPRLSPVSWQLMVVVSPVSFLGF